MSKYIALILAGLALGACATTSGTLTSLGPVCEALGPPLKYNPNNTASTWHAGKSLAVAIDRRDNVGSNLRCPAYK